MFYCCLVWMVCEELTPFIPLSNVFPFLGFFHDFLVCDFLWLEVTYSEKHFSWYFIIGQHYPGWKDLWLASGINLGIFSHVVLHILLLFLLHTLYRWVIPLLVTHSSSLTLPVFAVFVPFDFQCLWCQLAYAQTHWVSPERYSAHLLVYHHHCPFLLECTLF